MQTDYATQIAPWAPSGGTNAVLAFWGGINDLASQPVSTVFSRITNYWATAKASGFVLVGFTITDSTLGLSVDKRASLYDLNNALRLYAPIYCDYFVDVARMLNDAEDTLWSDDGVHWNETASRLLASQVEHVLRQGPGWFVSGITGTRSYPDNRFRQIQFAPSSSPQTHGAAGVVAFDDNALGSSRGALQVYDGTTNTYVIAVQANDTPAHGDVPRFTSGGTVTWESPLVLASLPVVPASKTNSVLDFAYPVLTYAVANDVALFQSTNRPAASTNAVFSLLRLAGDSVDRTLTWNANWRRLGTNITIIPSNKVVVVSAMCVGTAETGVTFGIAKEE